MLENNEAVTKLARQNMSLAEKIRDTISEISVKIKAAFEDVDMSDNVPVFEAARSIENVMDKAQDLWDKALEAATENYNAAQATGMKAEGGVQSMAIGYTTDNVPVAIISENILDGVPQSEWVATVKDVMKGRFANGVPISGRLIKVNAITRREYAASNDTSYYRANDGTIYEDKLKAAGGLDDILLASTNYINEDLNHNRKDNFKEFARGDVLMRIGGNDYSAKVIVGFTTGNAMVLYDVVDFQPTTIQLKNKKQMLSTQTNGNETEIRSTTSTSSTSIADESSKSNTQKQQFQKLGVEYNEAVENNDMEKAARLVEQAAEAAMPNSKMRTEDGKLRKFYHGTYSKDFTEFDPNLIGTARDGDTGFFGRGFYFAYSRGEARTYGSRVIEAYLNITNPFNFQTELNSLDGETRFDYNAGRSVFVVNFAEKFPELAKGKTIGTFDNKGNWQEISFADFAKEYRNVLNTVEFKTEEMDGAYGKEWLVTADPREESFTNEAGETYRWMEYGYQQRYIDEEMANNKAINAFAYLEKTQYPGIHMPSMAGTIMETDFTEELKRRGFDGAIQSEEGDEAVAFYPEQIKSADPVTYDDDGNVIPLEERFNQGKKDIRYQKLGIGETAEEQEARKESFDNLKAENKILRARAEYWKAQTRPTKERTVRQQDTDRLARDLLKKYESRADKAEVKDALKELGDWLVQTEELDYDELRTKAEAIAEDIISGNYALLDNSQQENLERLKDYLKSTAVNLRASDFRDTGVEGFRRKYGRYFTVSENGRTIDSLWGEAVNAAAGEK